METTKQLPSVRTVESDVVRELRERGNRTITLIYDAGLLIATGEDTSDVIEVSDTIEVSHQN